MKRKRKSIEHLVKTVKARAQQADLIDSMVSVTPYKVIVCGDFNSVSYEYPYKKIGKHLSNAFEEKGNGLGVTRYGNPFPIRIDNQFFSKELKIESFETLNNLRYSDHVPLIGTYICE